MAALSDYAEIKVLEHITGKTAMPKPTVSIALYTTAPTDSASGTEVTGGGYSRLPTTPAHWESAVNGQIKNDQHFEWPVATSNWGTIRAVALVDEANNILVYGSTVASKTIETGDTYRISKGNLILTMD